MFNSNRKVMKVLVIHPQDKTTDFLIPIYMDLKSFPDFDDVTIIRGGMSKSDVEEQIKQHDFFIGTSGVFGCRLHHLEIYFRVGI